MLDSAIAHEKRTRSRFIVEKNDGFLYDLFAPRFSPHRMQLTLEFFHLSHLPESGDVLYISSNMLSAMKEHQFFFSFSAEFGMTCARPPHDFLLAPDEFLILECRDGTTVLLEQLYG